MRLALLVVISFGGITVELRDHLVFTHQQNLDEAVRQLDHATPHDIALLSFDIWYDMLLEASTPDAATFITARINAAWAEVDHAFKTILGVRSPN